jgi:hypothetical protein
VSDPYPDTDRRRKRELLQQLEAAAARFVPQWRGLAEPGDFGRALLELGADLAEHVTSRLDRTAERDLKAFLNWLDLPGPAPTPAQAQLVFTLSDKLDDAVTVRERIQVGAAGADGNEVIFETLEGGSLTLTPARLERVFSVDPGNDRIETAPPHFLDLEPPRASDPRYQILSFAAAAADRIQITPAIGLEKGDWVRIAGGVYAIRDEKDGIYTIEPKLDVAAAAETPVARVTRFELSAMRDLQRHVFYLGHKELLNLEQAAAIELQLEPPAAIAGLAVREIAWELWGKQADDQAAAWQPLEAAVGAASVRLRKAWVGKTEATEVGGKKSRWLRARLLAPMVGAPDALVCDRLELQVRSAPPPAGVDAPPTVTRAFHNATPLPLPGPLLPFGPEPRLFDQFYLAAPEALSKKGARVTFSIELADASMAAVTAGPGAEPTLIGVARNGRVQVLRGGLTAAPEWREVPGPDPNAFGLPAGTRGVRFSTDHPPAVLPTSDPSKTLVLVADKSGPFWSGELSWSGSDPKPRVSWSIIEPPTLVATEPGAAAYIALAASGERQLLVADGRTIWGRRLSILGQPLAPWIGLGALSHSIHALVPVRRLDGDPPTGLVIQLRDATEPLLLVPELSALGSPVRLGAASRRIEIDAVQTGEDQLVAAAGPDGRTVQFWSRGSSAKLRSASVQVSPGGADARVPVLGPLIGGSRTVLAEGLGGLPGPHVVFLQSVGDVTTLRAWSVSSSWIADLGHHPGAAGPIAGPVHVAGDTDERIVIADGRQRLRVIDPKVNSAPVTLTGVVLRDAITVPRADHRFFAELKPDSDSSSVWPVATTTLSVENGRTVAFIDQDPSVDPGKDGVKLWRDRSPTQIFTGTIIGDKTLRLDDDDNVTKKNRTITFHNRKFDVVSVTEDADGKHALLKQPIDGDPNDRVSYWTIMAVPGAPVPIQKGWVFILPPEHRPLASRLWRISIDANGTILDSGVAAVDPVAGWVVLDSASDLATATVNLMITVLPDSVQWQTLTNADANNNPELSWEYFDGRGWRRLADGFSDTTAKLSNTGEIGFEVPDDLATTKIGGQEDYWVRARLIGGDYGQPSFLIDATPVGPGGLLFDQKITIDRSNVHPPEIRSMAATFELKQWVAPELTLTDNNLALVDQTAAAATNGAVFDLFAAATTLDRDAPQPALYLGMSKPFAADALRLLVDAVEQEGDAELVWQVFAEGRWREVPVIGADSTHGLLRPGIITLGVRARPTRRALFGQPAYWLRARPRAGAAWRPRLDGLYLNAAPAEQAETIRDELLGSTTGEPDAQFRLVRSPILRDGIELRVRERLGSEERAALVDALGAAAIKSDLTDLPGDWVLWQPVDSLVAAAEARVFTLDRRTGAIRFGNGRQGRNPPAGTDSVRAFRYRVGGGQRGNVPAYTVTSLKSAVTGVEAVTNPLPARGGSDGRADDGSCAQAVATVRHVNRAITPKDVEALALDFAPEIVRARCLRPTEPGAPIVVAIAVASAAPMPQPSVAMRDGLAQFLSASAASSWAAAGFRVVGPDFVRLQVTVELALAASSTAALPTLVRDRLLGFLHPTTGGYDGKGWPFGHGLWPSDVHRALADTLGEADVARLEIKRADGGGEPQTIAATAVITTLADQDDVAVRVPEVVR